MMRSEIIKGKTLIVYFVFRYSQADGAPHKFKLIEDKLKRSMLTASSNIIKILSL